MLGSRYSVVGVSRSIEGGEKGFIFVDFVVRRFRKELFNFSIYV